MRRIKMWGCFISLMIAFEIAASSSPPISQAAYTPAVSTLRIGLYYNTTALQSANLQNVSGFGSGFEFGYYDGSRDFVSIGAWTYETEISMVMDRNMSWRPGVGGGAGEYQEGVSGSVVLGCFHIQIDAYYETYDQARGIAEQYYDSFVKYESGQFVVMIGQYKTRAGAEEAITNMGMTGCLVNAGTSNTITIVRTGTNRILFEYDDNGRYHLGVKPMSAYGEKPETWFKGYRYCGGFQYARLGGALITVVNYVYIEDYIRGILPYEMSNAWPLEALKAQACCARTYALAALNTHSTHGFDLCTTEHCQVYRGRGQANERTDQAVNQTAGMYVTYNGTLCITYYASSNGGASENSENVWAEMLPYLRGVVDPYEADVVSKISNYYWTITYTPEQITQRLRGRGYNCSTIVSMVVSEFTPAGNVLRVEAKDADGRIFTFFKREALIAALGVPTQHFTIGKEVDVPSSIYVNDPAQVLDTGLQLYAINSSGSAAVIPDGEVYAINGTGSIDAVSGEGGSTGSSSSNGMINGVFVINGSGRGHSLGMSQWGAYSMAEYHGMDFIEIIKFYYTGVDVG